MPRVASFAVFLTIALGIVGGFHYYLWTRLVRDPSWPEPWGRVGTYALVAAAIAIPVGLIGGRLLPPGTGKWLAGLPFTWLGVAFILGLALLAADLVSLAARAFMRISEREPLDPERRALMARAVAGTGAAAATVLTGVALKSALGEVSVAEVPVRLERLPRALSGLTIAQLTDVHVGPTIGHRFIDRIVEQTNALRPDVVAITGDLVDGSVEQLIAHVEPLSRLRARYGVYFVTGNHEYYSGVDEWLAALTKLGIRVLRNEHVVIGDSGASIDLAGVDDASAHRMSDGHGADYDRAALGRDPERELVLLAHQPKQILPAARIGAGLQLSGHTHGGQIWPFGHLVRLVEPYVAGLHRHNERSQIYVSRGTGYWGPPLRLGAPAEITKIVLTT